MESEDRTIGKNPVDIGHIDGLQDELLAIFDLVSREGSCDLSNRWINIVPDDLPQVKGARDAHQEESPSRPVVGARDPSYGGRLTDDEAGRRAQRQS